MDYQLTLKQERFVDAYILTGNGTEAARQAGYSEKTARVIAQENLLKPAVAAAIEAKQAEYRAELQIAKEDVIAGILKAIDMAREQQNPAVMIQGCTAIARMLGFFEPETIKAVLSDGAESYKARLAVMSDAELLSLVNRRQSLAA